MVGGCQTHTHNKNRKHKQAKVAAVASQSAKPSHAVLSLLLLPSPLSPGLAFLVAAAISQAQRFSIYAQRKSFVILCMPNIWHVRVS